MKTLAQNQLASARRKAGASKLETKFDLLWKALGDPELKKELVFAPPRKWRFDFAVEQSLMYAADGVIPADALLPGRVLPSNVRKVQSPVKIAIEIEGGIWVNGAHSRGKHFNSDCEKYNTATLLGWRVFRLTTDMLTERHLKPIMDLCK